MRIRFGADVKFDPELAKNKPEVVQEVVALLESDYELQDALKGGWTRADMPDEKDIYRLFLSKPSWGNEEITLLRKASGTESGDQKFSDGQYVKMAEWSREYGAFRNRNGKPWKETLLKVIAKAKETVMSRLEDIRKDKQAKALQDQNNKYF